jgi:L-fuconate dehydratase
MIGGPVWDVPQAIEWMKELAPQKPWFIEEPTAPDDILGITQYTPIIIPVEKKT